MPAIAAPRPRACPGTRLRAVREAFALLAQQRGWTYAERDDRWTEVFEGTPFGQRHNRKAGNVVSVPTFVWQQFGEVKP